MGLVLGAAFWRWPVCNGGGRGCGGLSGAGGADRGGQAVEPIGRCDVTLLLRQRDLSHNLNSKNAKVRRADA